MPYQDRHPLDASGVDSAPASPPVAQSQQDPNSARTIQIIIVVGLLAAVAVAIFGSY